MLTKAQPTVGHTLLQKTEEQTIEEWMEIFIRAKESEGISRFTVKNYIQQLNHFLEYSRAQMVDLVSQITPMLIRDYMTWMEKNGHNSGGRHMAYRVLRTFMYWYENEEEPEDWHNPIRKTKAPKLKSVVLAPADLGDMSKLISTCNEISFIDLRDKALILFLLDTGVRARELLQMNLDDIDLNKRIAEIRLGKGGKGRYVYIRKPTKKAIRAYLNHRTDGNLEALWVTIEGERMHYAGLRKVITRRTELAKLENHPTLHSIRRAFAINMKRAGVDVYSLRELMGHSSIQTLIRYLALTPDDLQNDHAKGSPLNKLFE